jgi:hypothetical protein
MFELRDQKAEKLLGPHAGPGVIAMLDDPTAESLEAMALGDERMYMECRDRIGGIRIGHVREFEERGLFEGIRQRCGEQFMGHWQVIPPADAHHLVAVIDDLEANSLLEDVRDIAARAKEEGAWVVFLFLRP